MAKLNTVEKVVTELLEKKPETRLDDYTLIDAYYDMMIDTDVVSFKTLCKHHVEWGLPSFETIRRCRQKVQAKRPDLVAPSTAKHRRKLIKEYKDYSLQ